MNGLAHIGTSVVAAFLASLVEFVEAFTVVLAVWTVRGWKPAIQGTLAGVALLSVLVLAFGPLLSRLPLNMLRITVGVLLLLFGMRWLRKAILRSAGVIALHDEEKAFAAETARLGGSFLGGDSFDAVGFGTTFQAVVLEGLEVVFIVVAVGATAGLLVPAAFGATAAGVVVLALALIVHRPLARIPENQLKFLVGILISAYGVFWLGEGAGLGWPGADWAIIGLVLMLFLAGQIAVPVARQFARPSAARSPA